MGFAYTAAKAKIEYVRCDAGDEVALKIGSVIRGLDDSEQRQLWQALTLCVLGSMMHDDVRFSGHVVQIDLVIFPLMHHFPHEKSVVCRIRTGAQLPERSGRGDAVIDEPVMHRGE